MVYVILLFSITMAFFLFHSMRRGLYAETCLFLFATILGVLVFAIAVAERVVK